MTETVTVSAQGFRRELGKTIAAGQITTLMQRPGRMLFMTMARLFGGYIAQALLMLAITLVLLSVVRLPIPISLARLPIVVMTLALAGLISMLLGYLSGMFEIFGPYSLPIDWAMHKFIMALGGLFFPVIFFPPLVHRLVMLTPFPAILYVPGSIMIGATNEAMIAGILLQIVWLVIIGGLAIVLENRLVARVMQRGD